MLDFETFLIFKRVITLGPDWDINTKLKILNKTGTVIAHFTDQ